jgi:hypothetical protein
MLCTPHQMLFAMWNQEQSARLGLWHVWETRELNTGFCSGTYIYDIYFMFHCLLLFHSSILRPLSLMAVTTPSFRVLRGRPRFFLPSGFQLIIIFSKLIGPILSTCPYQISCFRVMPSNIVSCASIFPLIYSFGNLRKKTPGRPRFTLEDNIKMDLQELGFGAWTCLTWFRIETGGWFCECCNELSGSL